ncbi:MAG TPA: cobaltochelatase subunit CobN, partial [Pyrinomonadaceae bacterium]|nr:cobaltochelatase subunit CobN [Pyrinomonadaceae bacterium]
VGSSLLGPLKSAEREINRVYSLGLQVAAHNFGAPLSDAEWKVVERDLANSDVVFVIHVMDGENASRLLDSLERHRAQHRAVVVINCMPELMRRTRMGRLDFTTKAAEAQGTVDTSGTSSPGRRKTSRQTVRLLGSVGSWVGKQARRGSARKGNNHGQYLKVIDLLPGFLRLVPATGKLRDAKNYLFLFCYFLQPTPANIRAMLLYALREYVPDERLRKLKVETPQAMPSVAIYHPDAPNLFETFEKYQRWYLARTKKSNGHGPGLSLDPGETIGLLLMRPQVVSRTTRHYDALIRAIEAQGMSVIPATSTLMDNREACEKFFVRPEGKKNKKYKETISGHSRVSQLLSLTGFSFVGGPAMNDSEAAERFLFNLNRPYHSIVSLDMQTIESWTNSLTGLNPVQAGMQIAIPEIDGATEPLIYGGIPAQGFEPVPLDDRCFRLARRLKRWNYLRTAPRDHLKLALVLFCFPPNKGNIGTAADLDVFPSVFDTLKRLKAEGYSVDVPPSVDALQQFLLGGTAERFGTPANVVYRMKVDEYRQLCPYVEEAEREWGKAPGKINSFGQEILVQGVMLGNVLVGVQPTFGYEGDPMRLMMARSGGPHHGFLAFYTYLEKVFRADAVIHVGTHGALEFMPGKQVGLSGACWPDRLIGETPNLYLYSVNNPSEGSIAKRRSYAELISYLTPPIENAGLYKELANLKELVMAYRQAEAEPERLRLFQAIEECSQRANLPA